MTKLLSGTTVTTFLGDSFSLTFVDLTPGDTIKFGVRDKKYNKLVFDEKTQIVNEEGEVTFKVTAADSNKFTIRPDENCAIYYYGIKRIDDETGDEDTILLGEEGQFEENYILRVLRKKVEG